MCQSRDARERAVTRIASVAFVMPVKVYEVSFKLHCKLSSPAVRRAPATPRVPRNSTQHPRALRELMNFSEYISAGRTFFFDTFRVVTKTTAMMIFTPERLFIEPRAVVGVLVRVGARRILTLVITPRHGGPLMLILLSPVKRDL